MTRPIVIACAAFGLSVLCYGQAKETDERDVRIETVEPGSVRVMVKHAQDAAREYEKSVMLRTLGDDTGKRLDVEIKNESIRDALKTVLGLAKQDYVVDEDVPSDTRVTVIAKNVRLRTVIDLIAEAAGIGWRKELEGAKARLRFGKSIRSWDGARFALGGAYSGGIQDIGGIQGLRDVLVEPLKKDGVMWRALVGHEERSSIVCPHCKSRITKLTASAAPKCPKCSTEFKPGWKVCPLDGTKRPEAEGDWKYCPVCGKGLGDKAKTE